MRRRVVFLFMAVLAAVLVTPGAAQADDDVLGIAVKHQGHGLAKTVVTFTVTNKTYHTVVVDTRSPDGHRSMERTILSRGVVGGGEIDLDVDLPCGQKVTLTFNHRIGSARGSTPYDVDTDPCIGASPSAGTLPRTGMSIYDWGVGRWALAGLALVLFGALLMWWSRRPRPTTAS